MYKFNANLYKAVFIHKYVSHFLRIVLTKIVNKYNLLRQGFILAHKLKVHMGKVKVEVLFGTGYMCPQSETRDL